MAAGDTQEVAIAFLIKKGTDNLNSITELKIMLHKYSTGMIMIL